MAAPFGVADRDVVSEGVVLGVAVDDQVGVTVIVNVGVTEGELAVLARLELKVWLAAGVPIEVEFRGRVPLPDGVDVPVGVRLDEGVRVLLVESVDDPVAVRLADDCALASIERHPRMV